MPVTVRFVTGDDPRALSHGLRAVGLPGPAADLVGASALAGHLLLAGLSPEVAAVVRTACTGEGPWPRAMEGVRDGAVLVSGRVEQLKRLGGLLQKRPDVPGAAEAGGQVLRACYHLDRREPATLGALVAGGPRTLVLGVLNVTPDSFSDGGRFSAPEAALAQARSLLAAGADVLDVGGESTRPRGLYGEGARPVSAEEEAARVLPVLRLLRRELPEAVLSVDTSRPEVAGPAIDLGVAMVNDVRALADERLVELVAAGGVACCLMHMPGDPSTMASRTDYADVIAEVGDALNEHVFRVERAGVRPDRVLVDPGFGFGKTFAQNLYLLRELRRLRDLVGRPVLVGTSRKGFLGEATGRAVDARDPATAASVVAAILGGAAAVRVHDPAACRDAVRLADAVARAEDGGALWAEAPED